jgi:peroxiredoxin Q/BCP
MDDETVGVGARAPEFAATLVPPEGEPSEVALSTLLDDGPVLLVFYTADFTPDCVEEWCSFRDFGWFAFDDDVQVVGISKSGPRLHERFIAYLDLEFPLFADPDLAVADRYGVTYRALGLSARARRSCFLIDADGTVTYRWLGEHWLDPTRAQPPLDDVRDALADLLGEDPDADGDAFESL